MATQPVKGIIRTVKPLLSTNANEAQRRILSMYKLWYRELPSIILLYDLPVNVAQCREKLRKDYEKHLALTDIRTMDMIAIKEQMEFKEIMLRHKQKCHVMYKFKDTANPQPTTFLSKFFSNVD